jgi:hypothetical protein
LAVTSGGDVYVGGSFLQAGTVVANGVAKWNGNEWSNLGTGTSLGSLGSGSVSSVAIASSGEVYVGGDFTGVGGVAANYVARWDGTAWSSLGTGADNGVQDFVTALAVASNGDVYVGGFFAFAGGATGVVAVGIAKWNGTTWSSLGTGSGNGIRNGLVKALAVASNGDVYVGGSFTRAGGLLANNIAKWNGTAWSSLVTVAGNGVNSNVSALAVARNGDVYVGGDFTQAGGMAANNVAKWDGAAWSSLGNGAANGVDGAVSTVAVASSGDVYVGGSFTQAGGGVANNVAKWNGTMWNPLGTGANSRIATLAVGMTGMLHAGGGFTATGDGSKVMFHFGIYDPSIPLGTAAARTTPVAQLFPNPAHGTATLLLPVALRGTTATAVSVVDNLGRTVLTRTLAAGNAETLELPLSGLAAGVYSVQARTASGLVAKRLVVQ